ncbi:MAG: branched-chain amino acid transport system substrate-binding protein [Glaciecola sp.]|jgi:branched-chain amino acid transport system substrate-binding protein
MRAPLAVLLALVALLGVACGTQAPSHVRIGIVAPLTGPRAFIGTEVVNGATLAVNTINRNGGLLGQDVELVIIDDADLANVPASLASLAELARVTAVIGPESPGILLGPRSPLTRRGVPAILPTAFSGELGRASSFVARTIPGARIQAYALGRWLLEARGARSVAVLVADVVEGGSVQDDLEAGFTDAGAEVATTVVADGEATNLVPAVRRARDEAPDADMFLVWGLPAATARATQAVRHLGWDVQVAVPASSFVAEYRSLVRGDSEGVVLPFPFRDEWFSSELLTDVMLRYYANFGLGALPQLSTLVLDVPVLAIATVDAVGLVAAAVKEADSREPAKVAAALEGITYNGVLRDYSFTDGEAWTVDDLFIGRFHKLATIFDADPRRDAQEQRDFFFTQTTASYVPKSLLDGPAGLLLERLLEQGRTNPPTYQAPLPGPGPVSRPGTSSDEPADG